MSTATDAARELARARWRPTEHIRARGRAEQIVAGWPMIDERQRQVIREILTPVVSASASDGAT